jgi:hypothetical protein
MYIMNIRILEASMDIEKHFKSGSTSPISGAREASEKVM